MNIIVNKNGSTVEFMLDGRLDTTTSPELDAAIKDNIAGMQVLYIDMKDLRYISSAGLRVILSAQKLMNRQGKMIIRNAGEAIMDVFEVTGFVDILTIE